MTTLNDTSDLQELREKFKKDFPNENLHDYEELPGHVAKEGEIADWWIKKIKEHDRRLVEKIDKSIKRLEEVVQVALNEAGEVTANSLKLQIKGLKTAISIINDNR